MNFIQPYCLILIFLTCYTLCPSSSARKENAQNAAEKSFDSRYEKNKSLILCKEKQEEISRYFQTNKLELLKNELLAQNVLDVFSRESIEEVFKIKDPYKRKQELAKRVVCHSTGKNFLASPLKK